MPSKAVYKLPSGRELPVRDLVRRRIHKEPEEGQRVSYEQISDEVSAAFTGLYKPGAITDLPEDLEYAGIWFDRADHNESGTGAAQLIVRWSDE